MRRNGKNPRRMRFDRHQGWRFWFDGCFDTVAVQMTLGGFIGCPSQRYPLGDMDYLFAGDFDVVARAGTCMLNSSGSSASGNLR